MFKKLKELVTGKPDNTKLAASKALTSAIAELKSKGELLEKMMHKLEEQRAELEEKKNAD